MRKEAYYLNHIEENKEREKHKAGSTLMKGVTILAIGGIVSKIFGAVFRIPLTNMIGAEGQSFYGAAYPVYQFFFVIATAGFPVAISRMVSARIAKGDYINAHKSYRIATLSTFIISFISFVLCFAGADMIATVMGNPEAALSIRAVSIALLFTPIVASLRGYFQGQQIMAPTAISEVGEQMIRVIVGLLLAYLYLNASLSKAAAGATFGASAGMIAALVILIFIYYRHRGEREENLKKSVVVHESGKMHFKELISIVIPITIGSSILPLMMIIDSMIIMRRLQATGWTLAESKVLYGLISGYCDSLVNMPVVFIDAITISLIPAVTTAFVLKNKHDLEKNIKTGLKTMMLISYPCAIGLIVLGRPILYMLYPNKLDEAEMAVTTLQILAVSIITLSIMRTLSSCLQGVGKMALPVINLGIGAVVKIVITYILVGIPALNINGAAIGSTIAYLVAGLLNYRGLKKYADVHLDLKSIFLKPFAAAGLMGASAWVVYKVIFKLVSSNLISAFVAIMMAVAVYFVLIFKTHAVTRDEIEVIPKGEMIFKLAEKLKII